MAKNITEIIREIAEKNMPSISTGRVIDTEPIRVQLVDDPGVILSAQSLVLPSGKLPLVAGESIYLLSVNNGKIYYF